MIAHRIATGRMRLMSRFLPVGSRSILFGGHQFLIHPAFVFLAWWKLYGFPRDLRLYIAFVVHDLGYWGKSNLDGEEGECHVEWGANLMGRLFGEEWRDFCMYHSRFRAKQDGRPYSRLCVVDKLATAMEPWWLYLPRVIFSGEIHEYRSLAGTENGSKYSGEPNSAYVTEQLQTGTIRGWHRGMTAYLRDWVAAHRDGNPDTWTPIPCGNSNLPGCHEIC